jgi:general stress protein 26
MGVDNHEVVSIYPYSDEDRERLLTNAGECVLNWCTKDEWPVGVIMSFLWAKGSFWVTAGAHRHRISAIRRNPQVSIVVSGSCNREACPPGTITAKGIATIHEGRDIKEWFYPAFAGRNPDKEAAKRFEEQLDSPLRVVIEVKPTKWIEFDQRKFGLDAAGQLNDEDKGPMQSADSERMPAEIKKRGLE